MAEQAGEVLVQRVEPDIFDRDDLMVDGGFFTATGGLTDVDPVGGLVASPPVAFVLHKGFEQHGAKAVSI